MPFGGGTVELLFFKGKKLPAKGRTGKYCQKIKIVDTEKTYIQVEVPIELAEYVMQQSVYCGNYIKVREKGYYTHAPARLFGFYLLLKAESGKSGWIQNYATQVATLSQNFNISPRTFFTYIKKLEQNNLAFREHKNIRLVGWDRLAELFDINTKKREQINFKYDRTQQMHWWFAALEIESNQDSQAYMIWKKVNQNSDIKNLLHTALLKRGFDSEKFDNPEYFSNRLFMLYIEDFRTGTEVHDILIMIRSDINRSCKKMGEAWSMSPQLTSYWKNQMRRKRIIDIAKVSVTSQYSRETKECHKNKYCHVVWSPKLKERVWFLCDQITVLKPWKWEETLLNLEAA